MGYRFLLPFAVTSAIACGGATPTDLLGGPVTHPDSGPQIVDADTEESDVHPVGPPDAAVPPVDSEPPLDTGPPEAMPPPIDSGPDTTFACGNATCAARKQFCCATKDPALDMCSATSAGTAVCTNHGDVPVRCDGIQSCTSSDVCCGTKNGSLLSSQYLEVRCVPTCNGANDVRFCDLNAATDECATLNLSCMSSTLLPGFGVCR